MSNLSVSEVTERLQMSYEWVTNDQNVVRIQNRQIPVFQHKNKKDLAIGMKASGEMGTLRQS